MKKFFVIGHKNPDTDSIVSALGAEEYLKSCGMEARAYRAGETNNETKFILEHVGVSAPEMMGGLSDDVSVVLVDHNELSQVFDGLDYSRVSHIFDHHKMSIITEKPIFCRIEPVGSTSSLVAKMFFEKNIIPSIKTANLLIAGILSDTLNLTSPTSTQEDEEILVKLNEIAKIDLEIFASEMFEAKSSLEGISVEEIITLDYKKFEMGKYKVGGAVWETTSPESVNVKKEEIMETLIKRKAQDQLDYLFFAVIDILKQQCYLYIIGESEKVLAEKVFKGEVRDGLMFLEGIVSRKKQIVPPLMEELAK